MIDATEKPVETPTSKAAKPPTQTAGVTGIDAHKAMGSEPAPRINWFSLTRLPPFEMFVLEQSGLNVGGNADEWVRQRRATLGDDAFYDQYALWHNKKGYWPNETPTGEVIEGS